MDAPSLRTRSRRSRRRRSPKCAHGSILRSSPRRPPFSRFGPGARVADRPRSARPGRRFRVALRIGIAALSPLSCSGAAPRDLDELALRDGAYLDPETLRPFSGPVVRRFPGPDARPQIAATLRDGLWEGELTVYHETGRVRSRGPTSGGARCGAWIENEEPDEPEDLYEAIKEDLESLVFYPECPS